MRSFFLFELPCDVLWVIIGHLPLKSVYNMKTASHAASLLVSGELATGPRVNASFGVRNVRLVTRDCHRLVNPAVSGRMTKTAFMLLQKRCDPPMTTLHARLGVHLHLREDRSVKKEPGSLEGSAVCCNYTRTW